MLLRIIIVLLRMVYNLKLMNCFQSLHLTFFRLQLTMGN